MLLYFYHEFAMKIVDNGNRIFIMVRNSLILCQKLFLPCISGGSGDVLQPFPDFDADITRIKIVKNFIADMFFRSIFVLFTSL